MKQFLKPIPIPLQHQVLKRVLLSVSALAAGIALFALASWAMAAPFLLAFAMLAISAVHIYYAAVEGHCLELKGVVLRVEQTALRRRPKALLLEIDGKAIRLVLHDRCYAPKEGSLVSVFVLDTTPLYPWKELHQLASYLALAETTT